MDITFTVQATKDYATIVSFIERCDFVIHVNIMGTKKKINFKLSVYHKNATMHSIIISRRG
jgi:hypothetical protein